MKRMDSKESVSLGIQNEENSILLNSLIAKLDILDDKKHPLASSGCCIYRVPPKLRKVNEEAYSPVVISIGPFHRRDNRLESMRELKLWYLRKFLKRTEENLLEDYAKALRDREDEIRHYYSEIIPMESEEFVSMILTDACFIIEFFLAFTGPTEEDPLVKQPWPTGYIMLDLILLENQLPFFVLECLFDLTFPNGFPALRNNRLSFTEVTFKFFKRELLHHVFPKEILWKFTFNYFEEHYLNRRTRTCSGSWRVLHLNDMLRMFYLPKQLSSRVLFVRVKPVCSASQLREAGIRFKVNKHKSATEVHYSKGLLKVPSFQVTDWTETMIRNVVAFEQCHHPYSSCVVDYIVLWDHLINTEKDVEMLVGKGIIQNFLSDNNAVASLVNRLCKNVIPTSLNREYLSLFEDLNEFYENPCHKYKAIFKHDYLRTPWRIASVIAAILLLLLTLIQTICSVIALFKK